MLNTSDWISILTNQKWSLIENLNTIAFWTAAKESKRHR